MGKTEIIRNYFKENPESELNDRQIAILLNKNHSLGYTDNIGTFRRLVGRVRNQSNVESEFENSSETFTNQYESRSPLSALKPNGKVMQIHEWCEHYGIPPEEAKSYKLCTHTGDALYNLASSAFMDSDLDESAIESIIEALCEKYVNQPPKKLIKAKAIKQDEAMRLIYSDVHIAMETNEDGYSLYGGKWNAEEIEIRRKKMVSDFVAECRKEDVREAYIDDLGDFMDGWDGETARKGHKLPQNMSNKEAFDVGMSFKIAIIEDLVAENFFTKIVCNNIVEDNHSSDFGYVVNSAAKKFIDRVYDVEYNIFQKFINYYSIGKHAILCSHGKDSKNLKFGFKVKLDDKGAEKISQFIKNMGLMGKFEYFEFSKGDSHQMLFDYCTSDDFDYMNYPALSPSSGWVQVNFKRGRSGFVMQKINKNEEEKQISYKFFNWK